MPIKRADGSEYYRVESLNAVSGNVSSFDFDAYVNNVRVRATPYTSGANHLSEQTRLLFKAINTVDETGNIIRTSAEQPSTNNTAAKYRFTQANGNSVLWSTVSSVNCEFRCVVKNNSPIIGFTKFSNFKADGTNVGKIMFGIVIRDGVINVTETGTDWNNAGTVPADIIGHHVRLRIQENMFSVFIDNLFVYQSYMPACGYWYPCVMSDSTGISKDGQAYVLGANYQVFAPFPIRLENYHNEGFRYTNSSDDDPQKLNTELQDGAFIGPYMNMGNTLAPHTKYDDSIIDKDKFLDANLNYRDYGELFSNEGFLEPCSYNFTYNHLLEKSSSIDGEFAILDNGSPVLYGTIMQDVNNTSIGAKPKLYLSEVPISIYTTPTLKGYTLENSGTEISTGRFSYNAVALSTTTYSSERIIMLRRKIDSPVIQATTSSEVSSIQAALTSCKNSFQQEVNNIKTTRQNAVSSAESARNSSINSAKSNLVSSLTTCNNIYNSIVNWANAQSLDGAISLSQSAYNSMQSALSTAFNKLQQYGIYLMLAVNNSYQPVNSAYYVTDAQSGSLSLSIPTYSWNYSSTTVDGTTYKCMSSFYQNGYSYYAPKVEGHYPTNKQSYAFDGNWDFEYWNGYLGLISLFNTGSTGEFGTEGTSGSFTSGSTTYNVSYSDTRNAINNMRNYWDTIVNNYNNHSFGSRPSYNSNAMSNANSTYNSAVNSANSIYSSAVDNAYSAEESSFESALSNYLDSLPELTDNMITDNNILQNFYSNIIAVTPWASASVDNLDCINIKILPNNSDSSLIDQSMRKRIQVDINGDNIYQINRTFSGIPTAYFKVFENNLFSNMSFSPMLGTNSGYLYDRSYPSCEYCNPSTALLHTDYAGVELTGTVPMLYSNNYEYIIKLHSAQDYEYKLVSNKKYSNAWVTMNAEYVGNAKKIVCYGTNFFFDRNANHATTYKLSNNSSGKYYAVEQTETQLNFIDNSGAVTKIADLQEDYKIDIYSYTSVNSVSSGRTNINFDFYINDKFVRSITGKTLPSNGPRYFIGYSDNLYGTTHYSLRVKDLSPSIVEYFSPYDLQGSYNIKHNGTVYSYSSNVSLVQDGTLKVNSGIADASSNGYCPGMLFTNKISFIWGQTCNNASASCPQSLIRVESSLIKNTSSSAYLRGASNLYGIINDNQSVGMWESAAWLSSGWAKYGKSGTYVAGAINQRLLVHKPCGHNFRYMYDGMMYVSKTTPFNNSSRLEPIMCNWFGGNSTFGYMLFGLPTVPYSTHYNGVRYVRSASKGSTTNTGNYWYEVQAIDVNGINVALNKPVTTNGSVTAESAGTLACVTNGSSSDGYCNIGVTDGYVQIDLGAIYQLSQIKVWEYWNDGRTFHDKKVSISADGVHWVEVFNSNEDGESPETSAGLTINLL